MLGTSGSSSLRLLLCFSSLEGKLETLRRLAQASAVSEKRILVVDDDPSLIRLIGEALRSRFHCEVDATPNPEYGFELALKKRYRVFVFDFSMPMIDGAMLFTLIGKVYNHVNPPIVVPPLILISGRGDEARAQELMKEAGVRDLSSVVAAFFRVVGFFRGELALLAAGFAAFPFSAAPLEGAFSLSLAFAFFAMV